MEKVRLGDITINLDKRRKPLNSSDREKMSIKKIYPYCGANNIMDYVDEYLFNEEILCIAEDGGRWGKNETCSYIMNEKCWVNNHAHVVKSKEILDIRYLKYWLNYKDLNSIITGAIVKKLTQKALNNIEIMLPTKERQIIIVDKLDKIQEIIDIRKGQIEGLEKLIQAQFVEMFGDLKKNDKKWKYTTIGKECILNPKKSELKNISENFEVSFIAMPSISKNGNIDTSIIKKYYDVKKGFTYFAENDVLFAKITPCMENGKGAVAVGLKNKVGFGSTEFHVLRPKENLNSVWLYTLTSMKNFRIEAERKMTGSAGQKRVPISFFETYKLGIPPIDLQNQFANIVKQIDTQKVKLQKNLEEIKKLQESLMNKYFG